LSKEQFTFHAEIDDQSFARGIIHGASQPGLASDIGSLIKVVQELQLVDLYLRNSVTLGKKI
jgi:hypothetical protein